MTLDYVKALYNSILNRAGINYNPNNYRWVLGIQIKFILIPTALLSYYDDTDTPATLFGIPIEWDINNPNTIRIYEDVTKTLEKMEKKYEENNNFINSTGGSRSYTINGM